MSPERKQTTVDLVIPVFNEAGVVEQTHARICAVIDNLPYEFTLYCVDDGSSDGTVDSLNSLDDTRVKVLALSRNFGHQAALTAGMDATKGDIVITMDGDGQHPPEMIPQMIDLVRSGYDVVQTQRVDEAQPASFKKWTSGLFYRLINAISGTRVLPGAADFRALSRQAVDALKAMPELNSSRSSSKSLPMVSSSPASPRMVISLPRTRIELLKALSMIFSSSSRSPNRLTIGWLPGTSIFSSTCLDSCVFIPSLASLSTSSRS